MKKQARADKAFEKSGVHVLDGITLKPWTPDRIIAAQSMGMLWPNLGKEARDQFARTNIYPGALRDTIVALWLCTLNEDDVEPAGATPQESWTTAKQWAVDHGMHLLKSAKFWNAYTKFVEIMAEVGASATRPKKTTTSASDEDDEGND